jgi:hypothetical protein
MRDEFLAVPQLVRLVLPDNTESGAALLLKASSLTLKYLVLLKTFTFLVAPLGGDGHVLYGVKVDDDIDHVAIFWSLAETENELLAMRLLTEHQQCAVFLFNEGAINVCSTSTVFVDTKPQTTGVLGAVKLALPEDLEHLRGAAAELLDSAHETGYNNMLSYAPTSPCAWQPIRNYYITNQMDNSLLDLVNGNEGDQQENLAVWLTDALSIIGAVQKPQIHEVSGVRELTDVLFSYSGGSFLIESKTLSVLDRSELPSRAKLRKNVLKNISKALSQLPGACRNIRRGLKITNVKGEEVQVERSLPIHCVVLVPDLSLLDESDGLGGDFLESFLKDNGAYLHLLDPSALLRSVQHAGILAKHSEKGMPLIMAFDAALMIRWKEAIKHATPDIDLLFRVVAPQPGM